MPTVEERLTEVEQKLNDFNAGLYNSKFKGEEIDEHLTSVSQNGATWTGKSEKGTRVSLTLLKSGWTEIEGVGLRQTLSDEALVASKAYHYLVGSATDNATAYANAGVKAEDITKSGQITFRTEVIPEKDLAVDILRLEVKV